MLHKVIIWPLRVLTTFDHSGYFISTTVEVPEIFLDIYNSQWTHIMQRIIDLLKLVILHSYVKLWVFLCNKVSTEQPRKFNGAWTKKWTSKCRLECWLCETGAGHRWQEWLGSNFFRLNTGWFHDDILVAPDLGRDAMLLIEQLLQRGAQATVLDLLERRAGIASSRWDPGRWRDAWHLRLPDFPRKVRVPRLILDFDSC